MNITIHNRNPNSLSKKAVIDLVSGTCSINDTDTIEIRQLLKKTDFAHPLLTQNILHPVDKSSLFYCYEYDDLTGLFDAAKYVYATLISAENPLNCQFKIMPSKYYNRIKTQYRIPFSITYSRAASELISIEKFNAIMSCFYGYPFQYQDCIWLDPVLNVAVLPATIDGDLLYQANEDIMQFITQQDQVEKCDIRYINYAIGFGVFARESIKKDEFVFHYCGLKYADPLESYSYAFRIKNDIFNLGVDAKRCGNMARFINHAQIKNEKSNVGWALAQQLRIPRRTLSASCSPLLESNINTERHSLYGISVVIYKAKRDIEKGEQLLSSYGIGYFDHSPGSLFFNQKGCVFDASFKKIKDSAAQRKRVLRIMAGYGIRRAQWLLARRPTIICIFCICILVANEFSVF